MTYYPTTSGTVRSLTLLWLGLIACATPAVSQQILTQDPSAPINIKQYTVEPATTPSGESAYLHKVVIQEEMQETVTAAQLVFVANDGFSIQSIYRATLNQRVAFHDKGSGAWTTPQGATGQFAVLVEKVRFDNGDIWSAKHEEMATAIRAIDPEFKTVRLQDQPEPAIYIELKIEVN